MGEHQFTYVLVNNVSLARSQIFNCIFDGTLLGPADLRRLWLGDSRFLIIKCTQNIYF